MKIIILILILFPSFLYSQSKPRLDTTNYKRSFDYSKINLPYHDFDSENPWPACTGNISWPSDTSKMKRNLIVTKRKEYAKRYKNVKHDRAN